MGSDRLSLIAPGRVNLIGEHTDYSGGLVLPAAIGLGIRLECSAADRIRLHSNAGPPVDLAADGSEAGVGWGRYVAAVAAELAAFGREPVGLEGELSGDLPAGAGLSSSAALEVVVALALCSVAGLELDAIELARASQRAEHRAVDVPCGIMDQAASLLGVEGHALLLDTATLGYEPVPLPPHVALVILDSGVGHALESSGYADRRVELERATGGANVGGLSSADAEARIAVQGIDAVAAKRLRHVVAENERVRRTVEALRATPPDEGALGELFRASHESLRDLYEVSTPELDLLVSLADEYGAVAARMTGGGFGGSVLALATEDAAGRIAEAVVRDYRSRTGIDARWFVTRAADGARELV